MIHVVDDSGMNNKSEFRNRLHEIIFNLTNMDKKGISSNLTLIACITLIMLAFFPQSNSGSSITAFASFKFPGLDYNILSSDTVQKNQSKSTEVLALVSSKLVFLKKAVSEAKSKGINTAYEDLTIKTADIFLNTYIPWDITHPTQIANAFSRWSKKSDLKGTPQQEALRAPEWELNQTDEIITSALAGITAVSKRPAIRKPMPQVNINHLSVSNGFLSSDGIPVFSGGFIWGPADMDKAFSGYIGVDVGFTEFINFSSLQKDKTLSDQTINDVIKHLDALQATGQKGSIGFGQSIPEWAVAQWPDIDDFKGHFFSYDIDHPQVRDLWKGFIGSLVPKVMNHPAKFDYQFAIEPSWPSVGTWMVNNASPYTFQKYHTWLSNLYGSINALNSSWGTTFNDFADITSRPKDNSNTAMWYDWCRFNEWRVTDFFTFISNEIHKYDPEARCHMRISNGGINQGKSGNNTITGLHSGIDREALVHLYEINGLDNFMEASTVRTSRQHNLYDDKAYSIRWLGHTMLLDYIRSLGPDKLIYDSEWHSVSSVYYVNPEPPAGYMHTSLWLSALHGLGATKTWYWCRNADGSPGRSQEEFYGSLLVQPRLLNEYGVGLAELNAFGKEVVALERTPKQIYLLYSESSAIQSIDYLNNQMATYEALQFTNLPVGFVTENELKTTGLPANCKWLIIADASNISKSTLDWTQKYVKQGGKLLVVGNNAFKYNEYGKAWDISQLQFLSVVDRLSVAAPAELLGKIEPLLAKTPVKREVKCVDINSGSLPSYGVMCRATDFEGGNLVCLINVSSSEKEISLELNGKSVKSATNLFENKVEKVRTIKIAPLQTMLFKIEK